MTTSKIEPKQTLLIVDDDEAFGITLQRSLNQKAYTCHFSQNANTALSCAAKSQPDFCLLDLKIGEDSGLKLIPALLAIKPDMHIVIMTGYASISTVVEAIKLGAINYLAKPIDTAMVIAALENTEANPALSIDQDPMSVKRLEWEHIHSVLAKNDGNISATARDLNMHRRTLQRKLNQKPHKR